MDTHALIDVGKEAVIVALKMSLPLLCVALFVGLLVSLIQALTQIREQTITFVPKLIAVFLAMLVLMPYFGKIMLTFNETIVSTIINLH